ncbi:MAG TPA: 2-dehydropantoate 2-reductase [Dehalococcoidia bacterium]|nr:2-dehydropantoate 2-reductase [Dehalococcoidia bacterium]
MNWLIVGAGALGSILAAHLARAGEDVTLLARGARAGLLRGTGVRLTGLADLTVPVRIVEDPRELARADVLVLTVKTYDTDATLQSLRHVVVSSALSVQNGVLKNDQLAAVFGEGAVLGCAADFSGEVQPDGGVQFTRNEGLYVGELPRGVSNRAQDIASTLEVAGVHTLASENIQTMEWSKFVGWLALTPLAVLTRLPTYRVLKDPDLARLQTVLAKEASQLTQRLGIPLEDLVGASPAKTLLTAPVDDWVAQSRRNGEAMEAHIPGHKMSALQDLERGRRLEVEETFGYAVRKAAELGLSVPSIETCYRLLAGFGRTPS